MIIVPFAHVVPVEPPEPLEPPVLPPVPPAPPAPLLLESLLQPLRAVHAAMNPQRITFEALVVLIMLFFSAWILFKDFRVGTGARRSPNATAGAREDRLSWTCPLRASRKPARRGAPCPKAAGSAECTRGWSFAERNNRTCRPFRSSRRA